MSIQSALINTSTSSLTHTLTPWLKQYHPIEYSVSLLFQGLNIQNEKRKYYLRFPTFWMIYLVFDAQYRVQELGRRITVIKYHTADRPKPLVTPQVVPTVLKESNCTLQIKTIETLKVGHYFCSFQLLILARHRGFLQEKSIFASEYVRKRSMTLKIWFAKNVWYRQTKVN